jgi:hypothetical protein
LGIFHQLPSIRFTESTATRGCALDLTVANRVRVAPKRAQCEAPFSASTATKFWITVWTPTVIVGTFSLSRSEPSEPCDQGKWYLSFRLCAVAVTCPHGLTCR